MQLITNLFIRPGRFPYNSKDLGPTKLNVNGLEVIRRDFTLNSVRGKINCSWYTPMMPAPCLVYCHGNSGSRCDSIEVRNAVLAFKFSLFTFDFGGCGQSEGDYISLGCEEQYDIDTVVDYLKSTGKVTSIALWGRSMGAVAVMLYTSRHPELPVVVLDSPFSDLSSVVQNMMTQYKLIPNRMKELVLAKVNKRIKKTIGFGINEITPIEEVSGCTVPTILLHSREDTMIPYSHSQEILAVLKGPKTLLETEGGHNQRRNCALTVQVLSMVSYFIKLVPEIEDGNSTLRQPLPDIDDALKSKLSKRGSLRDFYP